MPEFAQAMSIAVSVGSPSAQSSLCLPPLSRFFVLSGGQSLALLQAAPHKSILLRSGLSHALRAFPSAFAPSFVTP